MHRLWYKLIFLALAMALMVLWLIAADPARADDHDELTHHPDVLVGCSGDPGTWFYEAALPAGRWTVEHSAGTDTYTIDPAGFEPGRGYQLVGATFPFADQSEAWARIAGYWADAIPITACTEWAISADPPRDHTTTDPAPRAAPTSPDPAPPPAVPPHIHDSDLGTLWIVGRNRAL